MNNIITQEKGLVMVFTAMVLPVILMIGALIIDGGSLYTRHSEIEHLSRQSGQSGLLELSKILELQATQNYAVQCSVETPPAKCSSSNLFEFLTATEIQNIVLNGTNQNTVTTNVETFSLNYDPQSNLTEENITTTYPYLYEINDTEVKILVEINTLPDLLMGKFLTNDRAISYQSVSYLPLQ